MRKLCLVVVALLVTTAAHAEVSRGLIMTSAEAAPAQQAPAAVAQPAPAPATTIFQTTNPQAQMVVKQLEDHGLIKPQPATQATPTTSANIVTLPAPNQPGQVQPAQVQPTQIQPAQMQPAQAQPVQNQVAPQPATAVSPPQTPATTSKPVVHTSTRHESDEAKARRIAARYGIHW